MSDLAKGRDPCDDFGIVGDYRQAGDVRRETFAIFKAHREAAGLTDRQYDAIEALYSFNLIEEVAAAFLGITRGPLRRHKTAAFNKMFKFAVKNGMLDALPEFGRKKSVRNSPFTGQE